MVNEVYAIALGGNIQPEKHLPQACQKLRSLGELLSASDVYESAPVGFLDQPNFWNAAVLLATELTIRECRMELKAIEQQLGRVRDPANKNGPRTIDLDIVLWGDHIVDEWDLRIPDPDIAERSFLCVPLADIAPQVRHPVSGMTLREIAANCPTANELKRRDDIDLTSAAVP